MSGLVRRLLHSMFDIHPVLDLHGLGVKEARSETERFLRQAAAAGEAQVRIVYGKGRGTPGGIGVLRSVVPGWLTNELAAWVDRYERELDPSGDDGAVRVWLRRAD